MKIEYDNLIVKKFNDIEVDNFNNSKDYIITNKEVGKRAIINKQTFNLFKLVDNKTTLVNIVNKYNKKYKSNLDFDTAYILLYKKLAQLGVIINSNIILKTNNPASYLALSFTLVSQKRLNFFIKKLYPLVIFRYFYAILVTSFIIVSTILFFNYTNLINTVSNMPIKYWILYFLINGLIMFLHEFGHVTSCNKLGADHGAVGFGFYLLSPVMFADVSDIWKLSSKERNYVNFSGLYFEIILAVILSIIYLFTKYQPLLIINSTILFSFFINLNPFLRYDGYWVLSDITNTPNLREVSMKKLNIFFKNLIKKEDFALSFKNIFLIIYASISIIFIVAFLSYIIFNDPNSILSFPWNLYRFIRTSLYSKSFNISDFSTLILPFSFYFIVFKLSITKILNRLKINNTYKR